MLEKECLQGQFGVRAIVGVLQVLSQQSALSSGVCGNGLLAPAGTGRGLTRTFCKARYGKEYRL